MNPLAVPVMELIGRLFKPVSDLVDELHTSEEEKLGAKAQMLQIQNNLALKILDYEAQLIQMQGNIVAAEAQSKHWLTAIWRPVTMLTFLALVVGDSFGLLSTPLRDEAWMLLQLGLGGYVVGRSAEKVAGILKPHQQK